MSEFEVLILAVYIFLSMEFTLKEVICSVGGVNVRLAAKKVLETVKKGVMLQKNGISAVKMECTFSKVSLISLKIEEFVAHSSNVNCLKIGKKACRLLISGGDDHEVHVWAIGKPNSLMSLCGHTSPVESLAFDSAEVLVLAGSTSGVIKLWDLEEAKMVRTLSGHRSNCSAVEFHPFGEFFASGSMDTNLKLWDIKKKGCIHTYKGHTQGISTIKFTPDGRWVVSGGLDNVVKVWDLTAGKLLHEFKFHDGHIRSLDFHPLEFLLATGSADRTVKFCDLETFELIGSTRPETTGVRAMTFHPDGRTLFTGLEDSLKVYSWEPIICHDTVDMGWSTLGDLCMHDGKLLGCSFYQNSVGVWVADTSLIEPYGVCLEQDLMEQKPNLVKSSRSLENIRSGMRNLGLRCTSPDSETKEIKNIYVDTTGGKPALQKTDSLGSTKVGLPLDLKEMHDIPSPKQSPAKRVQAKSNDQALDKSFVVQVIVPQESPDGKDSANNGRESVSFSKTKRGMLLRPAHIRRPSNSKIDLEKSPTPVDSGIFRSPISDLDQATDQSFRTRVISEEGTKDSSDGKHSNNRSVCNKFDKILPPQTPSDRENCNESVDHRKVISPVKFVNGVAVVTGRTRTLVERFERREQVNIEEVQTTNSSPEVPESDKIATLQKTEPQEVEPQKVELQKVEPQRVEPKKAETRKFEHQEVETKTLEPQKSEPQKVEHLKVEPRRVEPQKSERPRVPGREIATPANDRDATEYLMESHDVFLSCLRSRLTKLQVVRHFWERNDMKGAMNAMTKLPDQSVQADVISVLIDKMDILTLDLFSCLLPMLVGLLNSQTERHSSLSMEMLLKLIAVFGPVIRSSISAAPVVGVDLHAEQRRLCCDRCFVQLQSIQKILPSLVRRGGVLARSAQELNLLLQTL